MKCINCETKHTVGRGRYCSATCRVSYNRQKRSTKSVAKESVAPKSVASATETKSVAKPSLQHYMDNPDMYYPRRDPQRLNWSGEIFSHSKLIELGLTGNRVSIPGDWDYVGVAI